MADTETTESTAEGGYTAKLHRPVTAVLVTLVLAAGAGVGCYFIGNSSGEDLDAAREMGAAAGQRMGAAEGSRKGYAAGFKGGRERGYAKAYPDSYEKAYLDEFEKAGLDSPTEVEVPEP